MWQLLKNGSVGPLWSRTVWSDISKKDIMHCITDNIIDMNMVLLSILTFSSSSYGHHQEKKKKAKKGQELRKKQTVASRRRRAATAERS